ISCEQFPANPLILNNRESRNFGKLRLLARRKKATLKLLQRFFGRSDGVLDVLLRVGHAEEGRFELRWRQPHPGVEHGIVEASELGGVASRGTLPIRDVLAGEEECEHGADMVGRHRYSSVF